MEQHPATEPSHEAPTSDTGKDRESFDDSGNDIAFEHRTTQAPTRSLTLQHPANGEACPPKTRKVQGGCVARLIEIIGNMVTSTSDEPRGEVCPLVSYVSDLEEHVGQLEKKMDARMTRIFRLRKRLNDLTEKLEVERGSHMAQEKILEEATAKLAKQSDELDSKNRQFQETSRQLQETLHNLDKMKENCEHIRLEKIELIKASTEKVAKISSLQQTLARAGRNDEQPTDEDISRKFASLKNDIMQFARLRLSSADTDSSSGESEDELAEELNELNTRGFVARQLHQDFFSNDIVSRLFEPPTATGQTLEQYLRESGCPGMLVLKRFRWSLSV